jgi:hypothetical protein
MLRGVSLAPQQRVVKDPQELPTELVNSIIGVTAHAAAVPDYGSTGSTGGAATLLSTSAQPNGGSSAAGASPSLLTRFFRFARRRYQTPMGGQVPIFDSNGNLTTSQTGVNTFRFRSLSLFYFLRALPWTAVITYSILIYLLIVLIITAVYYVWGMYCGAGLNVVMSVYFTVVSLAANGGYLGEDEDTMTDSTHLCYRGRTAIVMVCSYVNIVFVGLVAALVVGKAEYTGKLGHRVVFSDFCTLTSIPGRVRQYRLSFRMANVDNSVPLAHGRLRVFCVTAEPLREFRLRQKQMHLLKHSALLKTLAKTSYSSAQQLLPGGEATSSLRGMTSSQSPPVPLTEAMLEGRRASHQRHHHNHNVSNTGPTSGTQRTTQEALAPPRSASAVEMNPQATRTRRAHPHNLHSGSRRRRRSRHRRHISSAKATLPNTSVTDPARSGSGPRGRRSSARAVVEGGSADKEKATDTTDNREDRRSDGTGSGRSSPPSSSSTSRTSTPSRSSAASPRSSSSSAASSRSSSSSSAIASHSLDVQEIVKTKAEKQTAAMDATTTTAKTAAAATSAAVALKRAASDITNSSMTSKANSALYMASPLGDMAGSFADPAFNKRTLSPTSMAAAMQNAQKGAVRVADHDADEDREMERVHLRVQEMRWTCAEESYLDRGDSGQLSLWFPVTITHTIDERSPLWPFMQLPYVAASLKEGPTSVFGSARSDDSSVHPPSLGANNPDTAHHRFQLVAVFDATEMESGSTITAKRTYTTVDMVAHYKFSDRLVHMQPENGEVMLDFHYFNALLPVDLIELSTTDSEM